MGRRGRHRRVGLKHPQVWSSESMGRRGVPGFRPWRASQPRPRHGDASMDSILPDRGVIPRFRPKHFCRADSLRDRGLDVDLIRLPFCLAIVRKQTDCIFRSGPPRLFGSIFTLRKTMPLLRAQHAFSRLVILDLLQDELSAGLCAVHSRIGFSFSHAPVRNRAGGRAWRTKSDLPTVCDPTPMDPVCHAGNRTLDFALARSFIPFLQWICAQHDRRSIGR